MTKEELINKWGWCDNMDTPDRGKWGILFDYKEELPKSMLINIDNDAVFVSFTDEDDLEEPNILEFEEFGYYALYELLNANKINADYV